MSEHSASRNTERAGAKSAVKKDAQGATSASQAPLLKSYFLNHRKVAKQSVVRLFRYPVATLMNWLVIGIAISFPAASLLLLVDLDDVAANVKDGNQITLFLKSQISTAGGEKLTLSLSQHSSIEKVTFIDKDQALLQLKDIAGFDEALALLDENPLPATILVTPSASLVSAEQISKLGQELGAMSEVDRLQMDLEWVKRLFAIMDLVSRIVVVVGFLFILAVMLVISNTIRLAIENRRKEITVVKLVGGTDSFVRRPFLYMGLWFGAGGALIAAVLIELGFGWLNQSVVPLASSYGSTFRLSGLGVLSLLALLGIGMSLGWLGARLAVRRHLQGIEP